MPELKEKKDVRDEVVKHLEGMDRNLHWLSVKISVNYNTLYSCYSLKSFQPNKKVLNKINKYLGTTFTNN